ncbi:hypothetical protein [Pseudomonas syringae]|uniref:hypothetical protein n=1 Tax=Pseudomonas syringae TaxID=317 RepID=UPI000AF3AFDF|nr:hypothetical protein [Pseudomonas syringae]
MKITKIALSILAIAISSSTFAATPNNENQTPYDIITSLAANDLIAGVRGKQEQSNNDTVVTYINVNKNIASSYKVYSQAEQELVDSLNSKLSNSGLSDDIIYYPIKTQLKEFREHKELKNQNEASIKDIIKFNLAKGAAKNVDDSKEILGYEAQLNDTRSSADRLYASSVRALAFGNREDNLQDLKSSLRAEYAASAKSTIENNLSLGEPSIQDSKYESSQLLNYTKALQVRKGSPAVVSYLYGKVINKEVTIRELNDVVCQLHRDLKVKEINDFNSAPADAPSPTDFSVNKLFALKLFGANISPVKSNVGDRFVTLDNQYKANENAKVISEFNALQEIALKEPDIAVKELIKQAADLKLAEYRN